MPAVSSSSKGQLQAGHSVTRSMVDAGYASSSRLYERTDSQLGMKPGDYRKGAAGVTIRYCAVASPIGMVLVAATEQGVCSIQFADTAAQLEALLRDEFPKADLREDAAGLRDLSGAVQRHLGGQDQLLRLPLDIRATAFQRRVWEYLQTIPYGETRSYAQVAQGIGNPKAVRAVATACASNPVALAVPCHRVVREGGALAGYRWGVERKRLLLEKEKA